MADGNLPLTSAVRSVFAEIGETLDLYANEDREDSIGLTCFSRYSGWASLVAVVGKKIREYKTTKAVDSAHFGIKFSILANDTLQCPPDLSKSNVHKSLAFVVVTLMYFVPRSKVCVSKPRGSRSQPLTDLPSAGALPPALTYAMAPCYSESV